MTHQGPRDSMRRGQLTFRPDNKDDRHLLITRRDVCHGLISGPWRLKMNAKSSDGPFPSLLFHLALLFVPDVISFSRQLTRCDHIMLASLLWQCLTVGRGRRQSAAIAVAVSLLCYHLLRNFSWRFKPYVNTSECLEFMDGRPTT